MIKLTANGLWYGKRVSSGRKRRLRVVLPAVNQHAVACVSLQQFAHNCGRMRYRRVTMHVGAVPISAQKPQNRRVRSASVRQLPHACKISTMYILSALLASPQPLRSPEGCPPRQRQRARCACVWPARGIHGRLVIELRLRNNAYRSSANVVEGAK